MIDKSKIKTVFVDVDDTVWAFTINSKVALRHTYDYFNVREICPDYDTFRDIYEKKNLELWDLYQSGKIERNLLVNERFRYTMVQVGATGEVAGMAEKMNTEYLYHLSMQPTLIPGARHLMEYLHDRYEVNVLSNGFKGTQVQKLVSGGVDHLVDNIILSDDCGVPKPLPGIYEYTQKVTGLSPESTVMIGDNYGIDILGAKRSGWHTIYFDYKNKNLNDTTLADVVVKTLDEIEKIL